MCCRSACRPRHDTPLCAPKGGRGDLHSLACVQCHEIRAVGSLYSAPMASFGSATRGERRLNKQETKVASGKLMSTASSALALSPLSQKSSTVAGVAFEAVWFVSKRLLRRARDELWWQLLGRPSCQATSFGICTLHIGRLKAIGRARPRTLIERSDGPGNRQLPSAQPGKVPFDGRDMGILRPMASPNCLCQRRRRCSLGRYAPRPDVRHFTSVVAIARHSTGRAFPMSSLSPERVVPSPNTLVAHDFKQLRTTDSAAVSTTTPVPGRNACILMVCVPWLRIRGMYAT